MNPAQVAHYRPLISADAPFTEAEPYHFRSETVVPAPAPGGPPTEPGTMVPPDVLFGRPTDPRCLAGIGEYTLEMPLPCLHRSAPGRVIGMAAVMDYHGALFTPDPVTLASDFEGLLEVNHRDHDGYILERGPAGLRASFVSRRQPRRFAAAAFFLHNVEPGNYGSFIFRVLPQRLALAENPPAFDCYVVPERTRFLLEALRLLSLPEKPIYTVAEVCGEEFAELVFFNQLETGGFLSPGSLRALREWVLRIAGRGSRPVEPKVYVSRALGALANPDYRRLTNELDVEALARTRGYAVVYPETLTLEEQIRVFSGARCIMGASGSGMLNAAFAPAGARVVDLESHTVTVGQHAMIYASCGHRYAFLFGRIDSDDPRDLWLRSWAVDLERVGEALDWLDRDPRGDAHG